MKYEDFIKAKKHSICEDGIKAKFMPEKMHDYLKYVTEKLCLRGRAAGFLDTGTGKTISEITIAYNYAMHTNKPVLIITPLAVAYQFILEAEKFGMGDIMYSKDGKYNTKIVVCNYERLNKFDSNDFDCVILDESSILKNFNGATKTEINAFLRKVKYRYLFTATPSPNDFIELGTSSEALGYMGYMDMLSKYFSNNENTIKAQNIHNKFYLKPHAKEDFFEWVSSWSITMRKPSDLGFSDDKFILPELIKNYYPVSNEKTWVIEDQLLMFNDNVKTMSEVRQEQKMTIENRCNKAVELSSSHDMSVYWCNFNDEGDLLEKLDKDAYQIKGSMQLEKKEEMLLAFSKGEIKKLITKAKMTAFGLNWQHCNHTVYFPTYSYEQYYQAIRRFWRYGQKREVMVDLVHSDGQKKVLDALEKKTKQAIELFDKLNKTINKKHILHNSKFNKEIKKPLFIA